MASHTTLENKFLELKYAKQTPQNQNKNSRPKIQMVAEYLRNREQFKIHYSPKLVSIGPIHHGNVSLQLGEKYKLEWAAKYIENIKHDPQNLHKDIVDKIDELKCLFADDVLTLTGKSLEGFDSLEEKLSWMLFVDGCSLLYILKNAKLDEPGTMNLKVDQLVLVMMDVLLLENQFPYQILKLLWRDDKDSTEAKLIETMREFLKCHHWAMPDDKRKKWIQHIQENNRQVPNNNKEAEQEQQEHRVVLPDEAEIPTHLLDLQRKIILPFSYFKAEGNEVNNNGKNEQKTNENMMTYRNIQDLKAAGIRLKSSKTRRPTDIFFKEGWFAELTLPEIVVDDTTAATFLNLIAYEMCPDFKNDYGICSFATFMDSLIDHPEDVKELRSKEILLNSLGSDEEVANLFNMISTDVVPNTETYSGVRVKIHNHYRSQFKTWIALGYHTYFSNPWSIIALIAALLALALTFVQTWFAINPAC